MLAKDSRIVIVGGAGTMGSSTALHLARRGYTDVRIIDQFQPPSANSAGNDMNKMLSTQYVSGIWGRLAFETWDAWNNDPLFRPHLHHTGRVDLVKSSASREATLREQLKMSREHERGHEVDWLENERDIKNVAPDLAGANIEGWQGLWVKDAGWMAARDALSAVGSEIRKLGVKTSVGTCGTAASFELSTDGTRCTGVRAVDGTSWPADFVVVAAGAWTPSLVNLEGQTTAKCWQYGHIQLAPDETLRMRSACHVCSGDGEVRSERRRLTKQGFYMEPSPHGVMKFCNEFEGYTRKITCQPFGSQEYCEISVPRSHALHPTDTMPDEGRDAIRGLIKTCFPALADRPLFDTAMCWCNDSFDGHWLLTEHPIYKGLYVASGDSGHTFKMLPIVGKYVADLLEDKLTPSDKEAWRWRSERVGADDVQAERGSINRDLADLSGWKHD